MPLLTQYKTFYISTTGDDTQADELNRFLKSHRIINIEKHFTNDERRCGWAFLLEYSNNEGGGGASGVVGKVDYKEILTPVDFAVFDKLRQVRKEIGEKSKLPLYAIFSNEQLAEMAKTRPDTVEKVNAVKGVSKDKAEKYGQKIIQVIKDFSANTEQNENSESNSENTEDIF